ncbi:MAG: hypothetical protein PHW32_02700 [Bacilli bacterium]|nr:hypothetical protein [Bacilli bacterium]MDD4282632.1 hypothetical protein [Bacilli bacterium]MDD4719069.1 hypothetical protein [Bacilli bacterium]
MKKFLFVLMIGVLLLVTGCDGLGETDCCSIDYNQQEINQTD